MSGTPEMLRLDVPADSAYLSVVRTAAAGLAARLDLTIDEIEDLRIAVDEAGALLLDSDLPVSDARTEPVAHTATSPEAGTLPDTGASTDDGGVPAPTDGRLLCTFWLGPDELVVEVSSLAADPWPATSESFAWTVLSALADEVTVEHAAGVSTVRLHKLRSDEG